ncbi:MAG TPA: diaminopimelate epimerase [Bryobacteraceae bacterium]|nr:diaminopimelate epimerase [Bryobacteraceae bacterium]
MTIPFIKAHGAKNDFLLTWVADAPRCDLPAIAIAMCNRNTGVGADGWMLVTPADDEAYASIRLFNSDGSEPEMSGNGTRCAAALLIAAGHRDRQIPIVTGAGLKRLELISREDNRFWFQMNMGTPSIVSTGPFEVAGKTLDTTILNVGNPQCAVFVDAIPDGWQALGSAIERHPHFPNRTNVSFIRKAGDNRIDVRFFERGCGETMSSGTGSTGAAVAAIARGLVQSPVVVDTPAGEMTLTWNGEGDASLTGPAEIVARGEFYYQQ